MLLFYVVECIPISEVCDSYFLPVFLEERIEEMTTQYKQTNTNGLTARNLNVAVVGGGLVGSLFALHLGKKGHTVDLYEYREDIRTAELVIGRSINLALSARGRKALAEVGLEDALLQHGIPMRGRMLHDLRGNRRIVPYDANTNQCIYSVGRKHLNEVLLDAAEKYPNINLHFNKKLQSANLDEGEMSFVDPTTKESTQTKADLIVGCGSLQRCSQGDRQTSGL